MSEFLAEALVVIKPDTSKFRAQLEAQLNAIKVAPISVPIVAAGSGIAAASIATAGLVAAQKAAQTTVLGLQSAEQVLNSRFAEQAVLLNAVTASTLEAAGAQSVLDKANKKSTASLLGAGTAAARLDAGLLALRTAVGSTAVIGLGALALAGIAAGKAISASLKNFIEFEQELRTFSVIAAATADEMQAVRDAASRLGADIRLPAVSAADAAVAMGELAKAGLSVQEAIDGAEGVLQLATAAQISNADAALIAANALNSFGLAGDQATRVADALANAANAAQGSITDFGLAFRQSSAVARQVGLSLEDTTAILSLFAQNGLQGSDAGTSLRVALIRLVAPSKAAAAEIKKLGLNIRDASGNVRADVFAQFGEATRNLTPAARDAAAALIFGQDAIRAVAIGAREGTDGLRLMQFQIDQTGTAAEIAAARTEGLGGSFSGLKSGAETLSVSFGKLLSLGLKPYVDIAASVVSVTNKIASSFENLATAALNVETPLGKVKDRLFDIASVGVPIVGEVRLIRGGLRQLGVGVDEDAEKIRTLQDELQSLQKARIAAEEGGQRGIADQLTKEIKALREEIKTLEDAGKGIDSGVTAPLQRALAEAEKARDIRISVNADTTSLDRLIASLKETIPITQHTEGNIQRLRDDFLNLGDAGRASASGVDALTKALADLGRQAGQAQAELLRLQTEGGTPQQQIAVLQGSVQTQRDIIENIKRNGVQPGDATAIRKAREQIKSDQAQIESLQNEIASDAKALATSVEKAQRERQDAFERILAAQLRPKERLLIRAAATEGLGDDIRFREAIIRILKGQIVLIRKTLGNTEEARALINDIQDRILAEANKLKNDQRDFRRRLREALEERLERAQRGTELDIELADINENTKRRISLREKLIQQLLKERKKLNLTGNALKENRNEIARINAEIEEIRKEAKQTGKSFQQLTFEFLQTQQGFAANLLGNLIPSGATGGLVGNISPAGQGLAIQPRPTQGIAQDSAVAAGRDLGFSRGQGNETNQLLRAILRSVENLNGRAGHPEARYNRGLASASMDYGI